MHGSNRSPLNLCQLYNETRAAVSVMQVKTITTDSHRQLKDPNFVEILVCFYAEIQDKNSATRIEHYVAMPKTWTPQMYLGALYLSLKRHPVLSIEDCTLQGNKYLTINDVHWLFSDVSPRAEGIHLALQLEAAFVDVDGGTLQGITKYV